jgi:DNA-binding HxlR family transcriptional regulator
VEIAPAAVAGRWTTLVPREPTRGPRSFGGLRERLPGISAKLLAERLRTLERCGPVARDRLGGFPVRTSHRLTPSGRAPRPLLVELDRTGSVLAALSGPRTAAEE